MSRVQPKPAGEEKAKTSVSIRRDLLEDADWLMRRRKISGISELIEILIREETERRQTGLTFNENDGTRMAGETTEEFVRRIATSGTSKPKRA